MVFSVYYVPSTLSPLNLCIYPLRWAIIIGSIFQTRKLKMKRENSLLKVAL